VPRKEDAIITS